MNHCGNLKAWETYLQFTISVRVVRIHVSVGICLCLVRYKRYFHLSAVYVGFIIHIQPTFNNTVEKSFHIKILCVDIDALRTGKKNCKPLCTYSKKYLCLHLVLHSEIMKFFGFTRFFLLLFFIFTNLFFLFCWNTHTDTYIRTTVISLKHIKCFWKSIKIFSISLHSMN